MLSAGVAALDMHACMQVGLPLHLLQRMTISAPPSTAHAAAQQLSRPLPLLRLLQAALPPSACSNTTGSVTMLFWKLVLDVDAVPAGWWLRSQLTGGASGSTHDDDNPACALTRISCLFQRCGTAQIGGVVRVSPATYRDEAVS